MKKIGASLAVILALVAGVAWWQGWIPLTRGSKDGQRMNLDDLDAGLLCAVAPRPADLPPASPPYYGLSWQVHTAHNIVEEAREMLGQIAALGADTVLISNPASQENANSDYPVLSKERTPSPEQWREIFKIAHDHKMRIVLMPLILLTDPRGTEWRGVINPPSWDDWFDEYTKILVRFARIAAANNVEVLSVGSELISTERYTERWRKVIREVRRVYPGKLTYSANWDHYKVVQFWDDLDIVGMTSYYKLSDDQVPTLEALLSEWVPLKDGILIWQSKIGKPLLFTEVGWCSQEGAAIEPWNYYYKQRATPEGLEVQRRCYRAFMETWQDTPQVGGVLWWEWMNVPGGPTDFNYTPKGKPAEKELRDWFKAIHARRAKARADSQPAVDQ